MTNEPDLWEVRKLDAGLASELHAGDAPALVLVQGDNHVRVGLVHVKGLVAALAPGAASAMRFTAGRRAAC